MAQGDRGIRKVLNDLGEENSRKSLLCPFALLIGKPPHARNIPCGPEGFESVGAPGKSAPQLGAQDTCSGSIVQNESIGGEATGEHFNDPLRSSDNGRSIRTAFHAIGPSLSV